MNINGLNVSNFLLMTAKDYLIALKVVRDIQRQQAYCTGTVEPYLADTLKAIEYYCPLDFSLSGGRHPRRLFYAAYSGNLFSK